LRQNVWDADGWTLYAEALRRLGKEATAEMVDGFGAALTSSDVNAPMVPLREIQRSGEIIPPLDTPRESLVPITAETMPRLDSVIRPALVSFSASDVEAYLDPYGGPYAYLLSSTQLVLGAGALGCFGPPEIIYLVALALALGEQGAALRGTEAVPGFDAAADVAFEANPCSLAASRVLAVLDPSVRGSDPKLIDQAAVLRSSVAFQKIAIRALTMV
jgi:hypothetical protein